MHHVQHFVYGRLCIKVSAMDLKLVIHDSAEILRELMGLLLKPQLLCLHAGRVLLQCLIMPVHTDRHDLSKG